MTRLLIGAAMATALAFATPVALAQQAQVASLELPATLPGSCQVESVTGSTGMAGCLVALGLQPGQRVPAGFFQTLQAAIIADAGGRGVVVDATRLAALEATIGDAGAAFAAGPGLGTTATAPSTPS